MQELETQQEKQEQKTNQTETAATDSVKEVKDYEKLLKEKFNVSSIDELIMKLEAEEEQRLKEQQKYKELAEKKEKEVLTYKQRWQQTVLRAEVVGKASAMGFIDPEVVLSLASANAVVKDDGTVIVSGKSIEDYLKELAEQKPYLLKAAGKQGSGAVSVASEDVQIQNYEDLLKLPAQKIKEFMEKYPDRYKQLKQEYFARKVGG